MKALFAFLVCTSSVTLAFGFNPTWEEIFSHQHVVLEHEAKIGVLHLNNACVTETDVRSIEDVQYCTKLVEVKKGENKDKWTDWVCVKYAIGTYVYPRTTGNGDYLPKTIPVRARFSHGAGYPMHQVQKLFTFPDCQ